MLKKIFFAVLFLTAFAACKSKSAFDYSQDFVKKEKSLLPDITATEDNLKRYMEKEQYDSIAYAGDKMEKLVEVKVKEIKDKPAPDAREGDNFKEAGIRYFNFIKSMYSGYKKFGEAKTPEARAEEMKNLIAVTNKKNAAIEDMQRAQKSYADANGFKLENK